MKFSITCILSFSIYFFHFSPPAEASADTEYDAGIKSYKSKDYKSAITHFGDAIKQGKQTAAVWLYSGHAFAASGQYQRAYKSYETVVNSFKGTSEATAAAQAMANIKSKVGAVDVTAPATTGPATGLATRITVTPPLFSHPPVSQASISAVREAVAALPRGMRKQLDDSGASIVISPNLIDRWPDSIKDLPEKDAAPTLAELPGRIYGREMCVYERAKVRGTSNLKEARAARYLKHQVLNMCFQVIDDLKTISKDPALRKEYQADKANVPPSVVPKLATFLKLDDWGPRETCAELTGSMLGGGDENTDLLYQYFPRTKKWLAAKLAI